MMPAGDAHRVVSSVASAARAPAARVSASSDPRGSVELAAAAARVDSAHADRSTADSQLAFRQLVLRAAARYRPAGRNPYYFARGKLGGDPVFAALLRDGRIKDAARIIDIGCGLGVLAALLAAAEQCDQRPPSQCSQTWPQAWAPPPKRWTLHGFDLRADAVATGRRALSDLGDRVALTVADARDVALPACDVAVMLDVLHYIDRDAQRKLLADAHDALAPGGVLLLRVGDITSNWRSRFTSMVDWWVTILRDHRWPRFHCRSLAEWKLLLESIGYSAVVQPMSEGTPFANVLLVATRGTAEK